MLRKAQCDFGWDWNIALAPLGLYGRIALIDGAGEIAGAAIRQQHADGSVPVEVEGRCAASPPTTPTGGSSSAPSAPRATSR